MNINNIYHNSPIKYNNCIFSKAINKNNEEDSDSPIQYTTKTLQCNGITKYLDNYIMEFILTRDDKELYDIITSIDENNIRLIFSNSNKWFNKQLPLHVIDDYHRSIIKMRRDKPILKIKIDQKLIKDGVEYLNEFFVLKIDYKGIIFKKQVFMSEWIISDIQFHEDKYIFDNNEEDIFTLYEEEDNDISNDIDENINNIENIKNIENNINEEKEELKLSISTTFQEQLSPQIPPTPSPTPSVSPLLKSKSLKEEISRPKSRDKDEKFPLVNEILVSNINKKIIRKKEKSRKDKKDKKYKKNRGTKKILLYGKNKRIIKKQNKNN